MNLDRVVQQLAQGPVRFKAYGNSMAPKIRSGDEVIVSPVAGEDVKKGDIVLARVRGSLYLHLVSAATKDQVQISNNHGHVNGWTKRSNVYGRRTA